MREGFDVFLGCVKVFRLVKYSGREVVWVLGLGGVGVWGGYVGFGFLFCGESFGFDVDEV